MPKNDEAEKTIELQWERVNSYINGERIPAFSIKRAKVPGGWLVRESTVSSVSLVFVPDAANEWK